MQKKIISGQAHPRPFIEGRKEAHQGEEKNKTNKTKQNKTKQSRNKTVSAISKNQTKACQKNYINKNNNK